MISGVLQGSVFDPLVFIVYSNEINAKLKPVTVLKQAVDIKLYLAIKKRTNILKSFPAICLGYNAAMDYSLATPADSGQMYHCTFWHKKSLVFPTCSTSTLINLLVNQP